MYESSYESDNYFYFSIAQLWLHSQWNQSGIIDYLGVIAFNNYPRLVETVLPCHKVCSFP
jgi:hypothetical protein